jgi:hypothetical protein
VSKQTQKEYKYRLRGLVVAWRLRPSRGLGVSGRAGGGAVHGRFGLPFEQLCNRYTITCIGHLNIANQAEDQPKSIRSDTISRARSTHPSIHYATIAFSQSLDKLETRLRPVLKHEFHRMAREHPPVTRRLRSGKSRRPLTPSGQALVRQLPVQTAPIPPTRPDRAAEETRAPGLAHHIRRLQGLLVLEHPSQ